MYIESVPNRNSPPAILLRESYREHGRVRKRTLCNLSDWPVAHIEGLRGVLRGGTVVAAALGTARKIGLDRVLGPDGDRCRDLVLALLVSRILDPASKLATARALSPDTATSSLGEMLRLGAVGEDELYIALDWLLERQPAIETALAKRHLNRARWCCMTSRRATWRGVAARSPSVAIAEIARRARCRSPTVCYARLMAARSRSKCLTATPPIR